MSLRSAARGLLQLTEQALHAQRRGRAQARIRARSPRSLLFVCHGNICRSPYAAAVAARALSGRGIAVASAGIIGPDRPSPPEALAAAARRGFDLSGHRSRVVTTSIAAAADCIFVMEAVQVNAVRNLSGVPPGRIMILGDLDPGPIARRAIPDPIDRPAEAFDACYARIDRCVAALALLMP